MALRIRNKWRAQQHPVSLEDNSGALGYIIWQVALTATKNLHAEDFHYDGDEQRVAVIGEYLCFLVHVADRLAGDTLDDDQRRRYMMTLANETARHLQRNAEDVLGRRDYRKPFIELFNQRSTGYSCTSFTHGQPGFDMLRLVGLNIQKIMGDSQTNRWAIDQVMSIDAPEAVDHIRKGFTNLFSSSQAALEPGA